MGKRRPNLKPAFLDSSVLFSATNSPTGGSAKLFTIKTIKLCTSTLVLTEVERNIRAKLEFYHLERFFLLIDSLKILTSNPGKQQIAMAKKVIIKKDAPILASAKSAKAEIIFTLDRKHFLINSVVDFVKPSKILTPKMFFEEKY